jgi:putative ABC transport system ATP-binding protein
MLKLLRRSVDEYGQTIVMVTHEAHAAATADRVLFLRDGEIVEDRGHLDADEVYDVVKSLEQT